jgi:hypothetical protein
MLFFQRLIGFSIKYQEAAAMKTVKSDAYTNISNVPGGQYYLVPSQMSRVSLRVSRARSSGWVLSPQATLSI